MISLGKGEHRHRFHFFPLKMLYDRQQVKVFFFSSVLVEGRVWSVRHDRWLCRQVDSKYLLIFFFTT